MPGSKSKGGARKGGNKNNTPARATQRQAKNKQRAPKARSGSDQRPGRNENRGAAVFRMFKGIGMKDIMSHAISWLAGYVYVGNGTLGATDGVYYQDVSKTYTIVGQVPILGSDALVGQGYVKDVMKHYSRKRIRSCRVRLISLQPATSNNMAVYVAPVRGHGDGANAVAHTDTTAALTVANTIAMDDAQPLPSYDSKDMDITPFIAGGSGPRQNEFDIEANAQSDNNFETQTLVQLCPACLCVSGQNATSALRGTQTHMIVIDQIVDILDFIGGNIGIDPEGLVAKNHWMIRNATKAKAQCVEDREQRRGRLLSELSALAHEDKGKRDLSASPTRLP